MDGWMHACMHACMDGWMDGWMDGRIALMVPFGLYQVLWV